MADVALRTSFRGNLAARREEFAWPAQAQALLDVYASL
jgi:hypothetical protein